MAFTYFFRDQHTLDLIAQHVIPELKRHMYINIWDAGCAMGPEPYSLAITLRENMGPFLFRNVRITATDIDEGGDFGEIIERGVYGERGVQRVPPPLLAKYFTPMPGLRDNEVNYKVSEEMRKAITFQRHDLLSLRPVRDGFGLIMCKNVLLHFQVQERIAVIRMFYESLSDKGFFVTEQTQKLPAEVGHLFTPVTGAGQIFQKVPGAATVDTDAEVGAALPTPGGALRITKDYAFSGVSHYTWLNLEDQGGRVGKLRVRADAETLTIYSLTIYPEFQGRGCASEVVGLFQETYREIVADKVRATARGFWEKLGFNEVHNGDYIWRRP
jgi:chemotaxis protein methyltransferase CheR